MSLGVKKFKFCCVQFYVELDEEDENCTDKDQKNIDEFHMSGNIVYPIHNIGNMVVLNKRRQYRLQESDLDGRTMQDARWSLNISGSLE